MKTYLRPRRFIRADPGCMWQLWVGSTQLSYLQARW